MQYPEALPNNLLLDFQVRLKWRSVLVFLSQVVRWGRHDELDGLVGQLAHEGEVVFARKDGQATGSRLWNRVEPNLVWMVAKQFALCRPCGRYVGQVGRSESDEAKVGSTITRWPEVVGAPSREDCLVWGHADDAPLSPRSPPRNPSNTPRNAAPYRSNFASPTPCSANSSVAVAGRSRTISRNVASWKTT